MYAHRNGFEIIERTRRPGPVVGRQKVGAHARLFVDRDERREENARSLANGNKGGPGVRGGPHERQNNPRAWRISLTRNTRTRILPSCAWKVSSNIDAERFDSILYRVVRCPRNPIRLFVECDTDLGGEIERSTWPRMSSASLLSLHP